MGELKQVLRGRIAALRSQGRFRVPDRGSAEMLIRGGDTEAAICGASGEAVSKEGRAVAGPHLVDCTSNDYLGLRSTLVSRETLLSAGSLPLGAGAARAIAGSHAEQLRLESELAAWVGLESALVVASGTAANQAALVGLCPRGDQIYSDELNHASLIDGCRLAGAAVCVYRHRDLDHLERLLSEPRCARGERWVVTETYFSMDGTSPDLGGIAELCRRHGARLILDESHALGVFGSAGAGLAQQSGVAADVLTGGFGKALSGQGGFIACCAPARTLIWNLGRAQFYSTGVSPLFARLLRERLEQVKRADKERTRLRGHCATLERAIEPLSVQTPAGRHGPIFPILVGGDASALAAAARLRAGGVLTQAIRPPTVPPGGSRVRITLHAGLGEGDVRKVVAAVEELGSSPPAGLAVTAAREAGGLEVGIGGENAVPARAREEGALAENGSPGDEALATGRTTVEGDFNRPPSRHALAVQGVQPNAQKQARRRRAVVLGTGTGVGKTFVTVQLARLLGARGFPVAGLKPIETGTAALGFPGDAQALEAASFHVKHPAPHPLYVAQQALTPALAFREPDAVSFEQVVAWACLPAGASSPIQLIETAGGCYSPLSFDRNNLDLALALSPAVWILVAPNRLGVLHDIGAAMAAMAATYRLPDWIVLSQPQAPDESSAFNAELVAKGAARRLGPHRVLCLADDPQSLAPLADALSGAAPCGETRG